MATIVLQAAGAFLGGYLGAVGAAVGSAVGAVAGYWVDQTLIRGTKTIEGQRLKGQKPFTAEEGAALPRIYGSVRASGTMIWATRFEERKTTRRGGKGGGGGTKTTEYTYYANVAFAICEGEIAFVRRVWADGRELDLDKVQLRVYRGDEDQMPDPLIAAKQGGGNAPAYRGTAYAVFERFALGDFGNRIPQLHFEVVRAVSDVARGIRAVTLIPGASEYALSTSLVTQTLRAGETVGENRTVFAAGSDFEASIDALQALCPNLKHVALVVAWFGNDLRCGSCTIRPAVADKMRDGYSTPWRAAGLTRSTAPLVSKTGDAAAYGGSPSDHTVVQAIQSLKLRGIGVTIYPLIMMDVAENNALPDPYGGAAQAAYPWRGRITCHPGPAMGMSADRTAAARAQINAFCGNAMPAQFTASATQVNFSGPSNEWGYRRFVLHFARLAAAAGGIDAFLIGSELRGLSWLRDEAGAFPFVEALCDLAGDVRGILGAATKLTYAADWSEYFGFQPPDGSGDRLFHLDPLWAHPEIDAIGVDNYMPLSDWRDGDYREGNPDGFATPYDIGALRKAIAGGEGFDWYYASQAGRDARLRLPISDGAYGKPWVYRYKDIVGWWSNAHFDRLGGVEAATPTDWVPKSKPVWFTELGCAAVDKGPNQPNVFGDAKSSENALPHYSTGARCDLAQFNFLSAHFAHWNPDAPGFDPDANPVSPLYGGNMLDHERIYAWTWDARPYPAFPARLDKWSDGVNWQTGHWLTGRTDGATVGDVINAILSDHGLPQADVSGCDGTIGGYIIDEPTTARSALEPIVDLFGLTALDAPGAMKFAAARAAASIATIGERVWDGKTPALESVRDPVDDLPTEAVLTFNDPLRDYQATTMRVVRADDANVRRKASTAFPGTLEPGQARALLEDWLRRRWHERETVSFATAQIDATTSAGATITLPERSDGAQFLVTEVEDGAYRRVRARKVLRAAPALWQPAMPPNLATTAPLFAGKPHVLLMDLPMLPGQSEAKEQFRVAAWQSPWSPQIVLASPEASGYVERAALDAPATLGALVAPLAASFEDRVDHVTGIDVELYAGELASVSRLQMLNGANVAAIRANGGAWEIIQFEQAQEISAGLWRLTRLLRGQLGTAHAMRAGALPGADFVLLDEAVKPAGLRASEAGLPLNWRIGPADVVFSDTYYVTQQATGGIAAATPLAPAHLRGRRGADGALHLSWMRCGRIDADSWEQIDIPMDEPALRFEVEVRRTDDALLRSATVNTQDWTYDAAAIAGDFGALPASFDVVVRQIGAARPGLPTRRRFAIA